jgi:hypothetical protein
VELTDPYEIEAEWRRCAADEEYWLENYWYIRHPERGRILIELREAQRETLELWRTLRYTLALKARQIGFSTIAGGHAVWLAFFHPDRFIIMLSKGEREVVKLLQKAKYGYRYLPTWMLERGPNLLDDNQTKMSWDNESAIESLPSASDPARGEAVYLVIVDEWAFLPDAEAAWASIEPITDIGGRVIGISTANGSGNFFHDFYVAAKAQRSGFKAIFYPYWAVEDRGDAWYEAKKRTMVEWQLHQEYPRDDVECFIRSGMTVFDIDQLDRMVARMPAVRGHLEQIGSATKAARIVRDDDGPLHIWENPIRDGRRYVIGADVAEGTEGGDFSVAWVIDTKTGQGVAKWHGHIEADLFATEVLWHLGWLYGCALVGVEANNMGIATALALQSRHYPNLFYRTILDERSRKQTRKVGWYTSVPTKRLMIAQLAAALRLDAGFDEDGDELWTPGELTVPDAATIDELKRYVREADGKMHGSPFDDCVMALAVANQMRAFAFTSDWAQPAVDPWSGAGWLEWADARAAGGTTEFLIGAHNVRRD